jgi:multiple sugar transport system permease protein/raffinose/stachyose/melibiose transport system permease protein
MTGRAIRHAMLLAILLLYTAFSAGPFAWVMTMSVRTTNEILDAPYALPGTFHWDKFPEAWFGSNYSTYFTNSLIVVLSAVAILTAVGSMAAYAFARFRFPLNRMLYFLIFSALIFPPQIMIIALFQIMVELNLFNTLLGLILVYVAAQLPLTVYLLEAFFARIPTDLFEAARMDGYPEFHIFLRIGLPVAAPALATTIILNTILLWNEFLHAVVLLADEDKRTLPLGIQRFMADYQMNVGMLATGLMIAIIPVVLIYIVFSERLIRGMTAGALK